MSAAPIHFTANENRMSMNTRFDGFHPDDLVGNEARMKPAIDRTRSPFDHQHKISSEHGTVSERDASRLARLSFEEAARVLHAWVDGT